ncbi:hypothetical protein GF312_09070, partial [Candidatus Poribacteria bacterium]|nr:hypothetical protein [Candidatus Poribacteria bacterium]
MYIEKNPWAILFLLLITTLGLFINGYRYGVADQAMYIPMIDRIINPYLFPGDYLFEEASEGYNLWIPAVAFLSRFIPKEWLFFTGYIITRILLFWSIYHISMNLFESRGAAFVGILFLLVRKPVGGTATSTQEVFFTLRSNAIPIALAFLIPYFRGRFILSAILCGITFVIHPITAVPVVILLVLRLIYDGFRRNRWLSLKAFGVFVLCVLPLFIQVFFISKTNSSDLSFFSKSDLQWMEIIRQRDSYIFISSWNKNVFTFLAFYSILFLIITFIQSLSQKKDIKISSLWSYLIILVCGVLFLIAYIFVQVYPLPLVVQLQLARSFFLIINMSMIYAAWMLWEESQKSFSSIYMAISIIVPICIAAMFISHSINQLILAGVTMIFWWICFHIKKLNYLIRIAFGLTWCFIVLYFREFFINALDLPLLR